MKRFYMQSNKLLYKMKQILTSARPVALKRKLLAYCPDLFERTELLFYYILYGSDLNATTEDADEEL